MIRARADPAEIPVERDQPRIAIDVFTQARERPEQDVPVLREQRRLLCEQLGILRPRPQRRLHRDQPAARMAALLQPIGVDQRDVGVARIDAELRIHARIARLFGQRRLVREIQHAPPALLELIADAARVLAMRAEHVRYGEHHRLRTLATPTREADLAASRHQLRPRMLLPPVAGSIGRSGRSVQNSTNRSPFSNRAIGQDPYPENENAPCGGVQRASMTTDHGKMPRSL